ncbi:MAG: type IV pilus secretin PilQ [Bdellovibrionia bacterium]
MARTASLRVLLAALVLVGLLGGAEKQLNAEETGSSVKITAINFKGLSDPSELEIQADKPVTIQKTINKKDKQLILSIEGATLDAGIKRSIDTSSFDSQVALISPYQTGGANPSVRIVVQLRSNSNINIASQGNGALITIPRRALASASQSSDEGESTESVTTGEESSASSSKVIVDKKGEEVDDMDQLLKSEKTKKFNGKPITLQVRDVDVQDIFGLIAETSGFNIILSDSVKGKLTLSLVDVPWDQALSIVMQTLHLGADRRGNVLRIDSLAALTQEKQLELAAKTAQDAVTPRITRIFPISYASLSTLKTTILDLATAEQQSRGGSASQAPLIVESDERTNSMIIRGLPEYVDRAGKLIEILDTQTPQVLIEGKVIEATENFSRAIGGNLGIIESESGSGYGMSFNAGNPYANLFGSGGVKGPNFDLADSSKNGGASFGYTKLIGGNRINATLTLSEAEGKVKVVSSPRAVVLNNKSVSLTQSFPVSIKQTVTTATSTTVTPTQMSGQLSLSVTPTVTSDGSVLMQLSLQRDVVNPNPDAPTVAQRNITTNVLVESGTTLVMGGFYNNEQADTEQGIPFLRKIPIIGWLFGNKSHTESRSELMFFITPQIINPKKAGLVGAT